MIISEKIGEKIGELAANAAREHCKILENECKKVIEKFNCLPTDLIIEYHDNSVFVIKVMGSKFSIETTYTIRGNE